MSEDQDIFCFAFLNESRISVPCAELNVTFPSSFSFLLHYLCASDFPVGELFVRFRGIVRKFLSKVSYQFTELDP